MTFEQRRIAQRLGIVAALFAVVVLAAYLFYWPKAPAEQTASLVPNQHVPNQQGKAIAAVFRSGTWSVDSNGSGRWEGPAGGDTNFTLGKAGDIPLSGIWDKTAGPSVGVFRDGQFFLMVNGQVKEYNFGNPGDVPVVGDWTGDGVTKIGVFRKGFWLLDMNGNGKWDGPSADRMIALGGVLGDIPVVGDWNGDGRGKVGLFRAPNIFALDANGNGAWDKDDLQFGFGDPGDKPVVGDWNGDGRTKVGTFRKGFWLLDYNGNQRWDPPADRLVALGGIAGDIPVVGDWNGDGRTKVGVYRQTAWFLDSDGNGVFNPSDKPWYFGLPGDIPVVMNGAVNGARVKK